MLTKLTSCPVWFSSFPVHVLTLAGRFKSGLVDLDLLVHIYACLCSENHMLSSRNLWLGTFSLVSPRDLVPATWQNNMAREHLLGLYYLSRLEQLRCQLS